jgi:hypothetical protein
MQRSTGFESESLQTDVMRFMAIIGFCLVAIFALVRNTDARTSVPNPQTVVSPEAERVQPPVAPVAPIATIELPEPAPEIVPPPVFEQSPIPEEAPAPAQPPAPVTTTPAAGPAAATALSTVSANPVPAVDEQSLSLGFTSDADFLRLVGAGTIELFVMDNDATVDSILRFDAQHPPHGFIPSGAPGQFYELLPATIPETITNALARRLRSSGTGGAIGGVAMRMLTWGVTLPPALERNIAEHRKQHSHGTLLIDRNAGIRHVPPV